MLLIYANRDLKPWKMIKVFWNLVSSNTLLSAAVFHWRKAHIAVLLFTLLLFFSAYQLFFPMRASARHVNCKGYCTTAWGQRHTRTRSLYISIPPKWKNMYLNRRQAWVWPEFLSSTQRLHPDKSSSAFSKCKKIPDCREHTIQIRAKRKTDPCTKNSRNAIRINLLYAEVKRRRWVGGGG